MNIDIRICKYDSENHMLITDRVLMGLNRNTPPPPVIHIQGITGKIIPFLFPELNALTWSTRYVCGSHHVNSKNGKKLILEIF